MSDDIVGQFSQAPGVSKLLGIRLVHATVDQVVVEVDVGPNLHQPFGVLHGGVSALLAEEAASIAGAINVGSDQTVVGTELNCSHLRPMTSGVLSATATPIRKGRTVQVWAISLTDDQGRQISVARCSLQVLKRPSAV